MKHNLFSYMRFIRGFARHSFPLLHSIARPRRFETPCGEISMPPLSFTDFVYSYFMDGMVDVDFPYAYINYKDHELVFNISLPYSIYVLFETFKREIYMADVHHRAVIDVGGFMGDSSVYYYIHGAKKVTVLEPHPMNFEILNENLKLNGISSTKVRALNAGIGDGVLHFSEDSNGGRTEQSDHGLEVEGISLDDIITEDNTLLKMDCEGCEFKSLVESSLDGVSEIIMEYHSNLGNVSELLRALKKKGFRLHSSESDVFGRMLGIGTIHLLRWAD